VLVLVVLFEALFTPRVDLALLQGPASDLSSHQDVHRASESSMFLSFSVREITVSYASEYVISSRCVVLIDVQPLQPPRLRKVRGQNHSQAVISDGVLLGESYDSTGPSQDGDQFLPSVMAVAMNTKASCVVVREQFDILRYLGITSAQNIRPATSVVKMLQNNFRLAYQEAKEFSSLILPSILD
jgi:hypothetical protein